MIQQPGAAERRTAPQVAIYLLHGLGQNPTVWQDVVTELALTRPLRAPWLPGLKPTDTTDFSFADAAGRLATGIELEAAGRADVVGHGLGAMVALQLAVDAPQLVRRLVLSAARGRPSPSQLRAQRLALKLTPTNRLAAMGVNKDRMNQILDALEAFDANDRLSHVKAPTLVVVGAADRTARPAAQQLARAIPSARLEIIPRAATSIPQQQPKEFAHLIRGFLDGV